MKKILQAALLAATVAISAPAFAQDRHDDRGGGDRGDRHHHHHQECTWHHHHRVCYWR